MQKKTVTALSGFLQGYQDIVNEKVASAIAKLEEAGLTPEACEKFLKTYGKVILNCCSMLISTFFLLFWVPLLLISTFFLLFRFSTQTTRTCWTSSIPT